MQKACWDKITGRRKKKTQAGASREPKWQQPTRVRDVPGQSMAGCASISPWKAAAGALVSTVSSVLRRPVHLAQHCSELKAVGGGSGVELELTLPVTPDWPPSERPQRLRIAQLALSASCNCQFVHKRLLLKQRRAWPCSATRTWQCQVTVLAGRLGFFLVLKCTLPSADPLSATDVSHNT